MDHRLEPSFWRHDTGAAFFGGKAIALSFFWKGSGFYSDTTALGGAMYLLDAGLAAVEAPSRLYVGDAFGTGAIHEIHPAAGALMDTVMPSETDQRPVSLASNGTGQLLMADFGSDVVDVLDRDGAVLVAVSLESPVASMGGTGRLEGVFDVNGDGFVDLRDYAALQACFLGDMGSATQACLIADQDADGDVDLADAIALITTISGP